MCTVYLPAVLSVVLFGLETGRWCLVWHCTVCYGYCWWCGSCVVLLQLVAHSVDLLDVGEEDLGVNSLITCHACNKTRYARKQVLRQKQGSVTFLLFLAVMTDRLTGAAARAGLDKPTNRRTWGFIGKLHFLQEHNIKKKYLFSLLFISLLFPNILTHNQGVDRL